MTCQTDDWRVRHRLWCTPAEAVRQLKRKPMEPTAMPLNDVLVILGEDERVTVDEVRVPCLRKIEWACLETCHVVG